VTDALTTDALVIGAGPAGLMAAEVMAEAGLSVIVADQMPSAGRKFLMAGKSGLNLTKDEPVEALLAACRDLPPPVEAAVRAFSPAEVMAWAEGLGQEVFTGSTGRVFPKVMKASPLLRAWLARLGAAGVDLRTRWTWTGWSDTGAALFDTPDGPKEVAAKAVILALGGASWPRLGSDGAWVERFPQVAPFQPANMGFRVDWSAHMRPHFGRALKGIALSAGAGMSRGELVVSERGLEGGGIYEVSRDMREGAALRIDLLPDWPVEKIRAALSAPRGKETLTNSLRKRLRLDPLAIALLQEYGRPFPTDLAPLIKAVPVRHAGPRPIAEAISSAGGLRFDALDDDFMLRGHPGLFAAGEMLDWEAPTGGYLITVSLATGRAAGLAAVRLIRG
jgi:uncharacterized flavoprotein (TIGR03862 family)